MIKEILKEKKITIASIQKRSGIPYTTLNDFINGRTDVDSVSVKVLVAIAESLGRTLNETYRLCKENQLEQGRIEIKNKTYKLMYKGKEYNLCKVSPLNTTYIRDIAKTMIENVERKERFESWETTI